MRGFTLIELLVAISIVLILAGIAIPLFERMYLINAMKAVILTDLRTCISLIVAKANTEGLSPSEVVSECPKSPYTVRIVLESESPIVLTAHGESEVGSLSCTYNEESGSVSCDGTF